MTALVTGAVDSPIPSKGNVVRVLLIEDNADDARLLICALEQAGTQFRIDLAACLVDAQTRLCGSAYDVVLSDLSLPDSEGVESVVAIRQLAPHVPLVVMTGLDDDCVALEALKLGAQDYLNKDRANSDILERAIRYAIQRQQNVEMERLLKTLQKSEKLLARKNKKLIQLNRTAHRFVDNVSHEFRTPLTVISEYVSIVRDGLAGPLNEKQHRMLDVSVDRADDLNNMVNDMLDISRLGAGILGLYRKPAQMEKIIARLRSNLERKAAIKGVSLTFDVNPHTPPVFCDSEKIGRVLINLAVNAIKFCGQAGHVRIQVEADPIEPQVVTSVIDTGPGIDPEHLGELFERFKQLGTESGSSTKGFGLGLNIAKELVELNFGEIHVESGLGRGSKFSFTIPCNDPEEITRRYLSQARKRGIPDVSVLDVTVEASVDAVLAEDVDIFLNHLLRRYDLVYRAGKRRWLVLLNASAADAGLFMKRCKKVLKQTNRNRPGSCLPQLTARIVTTMAPTEIGLCETIRSVIEAPPQMVPPVPTALGTSGSVASTLVTLG